jgi:hypothetical protein
MANSVNPVKVNGFASAPEQALAASFDIFTVTDVTKTAAMHSNKYVLDAVIQALSTVCTPVVLGAIDASGANGIMKIAMDRKGFTATQLQSAITGLGNAAAQNVGNAFDANGNATAWADMTGFTVTGPVGL